MCSTPNLLDDLHLLFDEEGRPTWGSADLSQATPVGGADQDTSLLGANPRRATGNGRASLAGASEIMAADLISCRDPTSW
jgi:hypothetical protein|uniref:hypothetical protein n=1 Tax=Pseudonocardia dioxanivorans TaxID=240495 RepID=UPI0015E85B55|nr:hypothetical protein [Pseudonocardia dioxanivorans]